MFIEFGLRCSRSIRSEIERSMCRSDGAIKSRAFREL